MRLSGETKGIRSRNDFQFSNPLRGRYFVLLRLYGRSDRRIWFTCNVYRIDVIPPAGKTRSRSSPFYPHDADFVRVFVTSVAFYIGIGIGIGVRSPHRSHLIRRRVNLFVLMIPEKFGDHFYTSRARNFCITSLSYNLEERSKIIHLLNFTTFVPFASSRVALFIEIAVSGVHLSPTSFASLC